MKSERKPSLEERVSRPSTSNGDVHRLSPAGTIPAQGPALGFAGLKRCESLKGRQRLAPDVSPGKGQSKDAESRRDDSD